MIFYNIFEVYVTYPPAPKALEKFLASKHDWLIFLHKGVGFFERKKKKLGGSLKKPLLAAEAIVKNKIAT